MGSALCQAFIECNVFEAKNIIVTDHSKKKAQNLKKKFKIRIAKNNEELFKSDILLLAVKPQNFKELSEEIRGRLSKNALIISIMAGIPVNGIIKELKHNRIIRAMPNTPALVNEGVIGWYASKEVTAAEKKKVQKILSAAGHAFEVKKESHIDDITSLSGCGPGFFFYLFDQWLKATKALHLKEKDRKIILLKTMKGALTLLESSKDTPLELSKKVASKGGATEQGLKVLQKAKLKIIFQKMLKAAYNRCKDLNS